MRIAVLAVALAALCVSLVSGAAAQTAVPSPTNLELTGATQTTLSVAWGPTLPGPFAIVDAGGSSVTVGWGASQDSRSAVSYRVSKDGAMSVTVDTNQYRFAGVQKTPSFRVCVTAVNGAGQLSPTACGTITRH